jgi:hypothetical protein
MLLVKLSRHDTQLTVPLLISQSIWQYTVWLLLQKGQLNCSSSLAAACRTTSQNQRGVEADEDGMGAMGHGAVAWAFAGCSGTACGLGSC